MIESIFAYRICESLYCPKCYEKAEQSLPKDSGVKLPGIPIKKEDLDLFICKQCKEIKISSEIKVPFPIKIPSIINVIKVSSGEESKAPVKEKDLSDLRDMIENCTTKISVVTEVLCKGEPGYNLEISERGASGLGFILGDIQDDLNFIVDKICEKQRRGLIVEKAVS